VFFYWHRIRGHELERIAAAFDVLVDRMLPLPAEQAAPASEAS
jgi:hypothetical protein